MEKIKVTVWNEYAHERQSEAIAKIYPKGIHEAIAEGLRKNAELEIRVATLDMPECGLTQEVLDDTDVLTWWGHIGHDKVPDEIVNRVKESVLKGMGLIVLHSGHHSKIFRSLMGTTGNLTWREDDDLERIWTINHAHPIAQGIGRYFELDGVETYGEPFGIPEPDEVVFVGWYDGGEVFRSGCTFHRGNGRIFYFQPGHETYPIFYNENVQKVITNAVHWAAPVLRSPSLDCPHVRPVHPKVNKTEE